MKFDDCDLIESNKGELIAINWEPSSVRHFEIFAVSQFPTRPTVEITTYEDSFIVKVSILFPIKNVKMNVEFVAPRALRGPAGIPDVSDIAMSLATKPAITAVKFRNTWIACWDIP